MAEAQLFATGTGLMRNQDLEIPNYVRGRMGAFLLAVSVCAGCRSASYSAVFWREKGFADLQRLFWSCDMSTNLMDSKSR